LVFAERQDGTAQVVEERRRGLHQRRRRGDRWRQDAIGRRRCQHAVDARLDRRAMGGDPAEEEVSLVTFGGRASNF